MKRDFRAESFPVRPPPLGHTPVPPALGHVPPPPPGVVPGLAPVPPPPAGLVPPPPRVLHHDSDHSPSPSPPPAKHNPVFKPANSKGFGIKMSLSSSSANPTIKPKPTAPKKAAVISSVFNDDSSDDEEEIPAEARYLCYIAPLSGG